MEIIREKTSLICEECGKPIYKDEGFYTGQYIHHAPTCDNVLGPDQCKQYHPPAGLKRIYKFVYLDRSFKRRAGFHFEGEGI